MGRREDHLPRWKVMRRSSPRAAVAVAFLFLGFLLPGVAASSSIDITETPAYIDCDATLAQYSPYAYYIVASLYGDAAAGGISGAEFRIAAHPADWITNVVPNPAASVAIGNPLVEGGTIAFPSCIGTPAQPVLLYTVTGVALSSISERQLRVLSHSRPGGWGGFPCIRVTLCDAPVFTWLCVGGGTYCINAPHTCCILDAETSSWTRVKALFQ